MMATELLTLTAAAAELGISRERVNQLVLKERLKATKPSRDWLITRADLEVFRKVARPKGRPSKSAA